MRIDRVPSTQDLARDQLEDLPVLVLARSQSEGRGRSGSDWTTADRALAASLAFRDDREERRPLSLLAGVAAARVTKRTSLKWPNDVLVDGAKVGGILVERSAGVTVVGLGLNLWWPTPAVDAGALFDRDPGGDAHAEIGSMWGAELIELLDSEGWPIDDYRSRCDTIGNDVTWEPLGEGKAVDVASDGSLIVETRSGREQIYSGAVRHVRMS